MQSIIGILTHYNHIRLAFYFDISNTENVLNWVINIRRRNFSAQFDSKSRSVFVWSDIKSGSENADSSSFQLKTILKSKFPGYVSRAVFLALSERKSGCGKVHGGDWWTTSRDWGWCTVTRANNNGHIRVCVSGRWAPSGCELRGWINRVET